jgi:ParB family chromosome partitioning protein
MNAITTIEQCDQIALLSLKQIHIEPGHNPRRFKNKVRIEQMRQSIEREGVLQPILVRPDPKGGYKVVAGQTRYEIAAELGLEKIPALIKPLSDEEAKTAALTENCLRTDMNAIDEGMAAQGHLIKCKGDMDEVMRITGWSRRKLEARILLTNATDSVAEALSNELINIGHAEILSCMRPDKQDAALKWVMDKGVSVADLRTKVESLTLHLDTAVFNTSECNGCNHNTSKQVGLFDAGMAKSRCLNATCFQSKVDAHLQAIVDEQKEKFPCVRLDKQVAADTFCDLEIDGKNGVGEVQYKACQSCEHFGAIVKTGLGNVGEVQDNLCMNLLCHSDKVKAHAATLIASDKPKTVAPKISANVAPLAVTDSESESDEDEGSDAGASGEDETPQTVAKADSLSQKLINFHHQVHRSAAAAVVRQDKVLAKALAVLAVMADGNVSLNKTPDGWPRLLSGKERGVALGILSGMAEEKLDAMLVEMAARTLKSSKSPYGGDKTPEDDTFGAAAMSVLRLHDHDLSKQFTLTVEYLDMLTKGAIATMLQESGFAADYDSKKSPKAFSKLMAMKKSEIMEAVTESGFDFSGFIPAHMTITN